MLASKPSPDRARRLALARRLTEALPAPERPKTSPLPVPLGCAAMEAALPRGGLGRETLHEISPASTADWPAALGFVSALVACGLAGAEGLALLVTSAESPSGSGRLYGHGLNGLGLDPGRLVLVETEADRDALWALEETLRARALAAVAGLVGSGIDLKASRRLQLAAAGSGALLLLLRPAEADEVNGAGTRWRVGAAPAERDRFGCFGRCRWRLQLKRCRNGRTGAWTMEWDHEARGFRLVETMAGDALSPHAVTGQPGARQAG